MRSIIARPNGDGSGPRRGLRSVVFRSTVVLGGLMTCLVGDAVGQEMPAPVDQQVALLTKVLQFDRSLAERANGELVVAVVYQSRFRESLTTQEAVVARLTDGVVGHLRIVVVPVELGGDVAPLQALADVGAHVVYVTPLRALAISDLVSSTRSLGMLSVTGVPAYVNEGLSIGVSVRGDRPEILINLEASLAEGARLSSELLKLSRVIQASGGEDE